MRVLFTALNVFVCTTRGGKKGVSFVKHFCVIDLSSSISMLWMDACVELISPSCVYMLLCWITQKIVESSSFHHFTVFYQNQSLSQNLTSLSCVEGIFNNHMAIKASMNRIKQHCRIIQGVTGANSVRVLCV